MTQIISRLSILLCLAYGASSSAQPNSGSIPDYESIPFSFSPETEKLISIDADNDGLVDILSISKQGMALYFQDSREAVASFDFTNPSVKLEFNSQNIGWQISKNYPIANSNSGFAVLLFSEGQRVIQWSLNGRELTAPVELLSGLNGFAGGGINSLHLSQDINADGLEDLVIPAAGSLQLHIRNADGSYQEALQVMSDMGIDTRLSLQQSLERDIGQSIRIPQIELRDVNNDKRPDIISRTEERFDVFLAQQQDSRYFLPTPSFSLDLIEVRERMGNFDFDQLDFSNLTGMLALTHEEILDDVDGDGIEDFVLREGAKVSLFKGLPNGMDLSQPRQVLRSGGNVLTSFLHDENEDGKKDLWLWRIEPISVGDIFLWLAISGSIDVEAFIYLNEGESFARRPARKVTITLKFPSVVRAISTVMDFREQTQAASEALYTPTTVAGINGVDANDVIVLLENQIQFFLDSIQVQEPASEDRFLGSIGYSRQRDAYEIDLRRLIEDVEIEQQSELTAVANRTPNFAVSLSGAMRNGDVLATHMNGDMYEDVFVFLQRTRESITGILLLSQ
jgi:hypothetical protein